MTAPNGEKIHRPDCTFEGYAAIFNEPDQDGDIIRPGAFKKTLAKRHPAMLWRHDHDQPIGGWLDIQEDERGLRVVGRIITETARGAELWELVRTGAVTGLSIGYRVKQFELNEKGWAAVNEHGGRIITDIDLAEISLVAVPSVAEARIDKIRLTPGGKS